MMRRKRKRKQERREGGERRGVSMNDNKTELIFLVNPNNSY